MSSVTFGQFLDFIWHSIVVISTLAGITALFQFIKPIRRKTINFIRRWLLIENDAQALQELRNTVRSEMKEIRQLIVELEIQTNQRLDEMKAETGQGLATSKALLDDSFQQIADLKQRLEHIETIQNSHTRANAILFDVIKQNSPPGA